MTVTVPFVCSLSPALRLTAHAVPSVKDRIAEMAACVAERIDKNRPVAATLRAPVAIPGARSARQIDMRSEPNGGGEILFKTWTSWDVEHNCWLVMMEHATEDYWETEMEIGK